MCLSGRLSLTGIIDGHGRQILPQAIHADNAVSESAARYDDDGALDRPGVQKAYRPIAFRQRIASIVRVLLGVQIQVEPLEVTEKH